MVLGRWKTPFPKSESKFEAGFSGFGVGGFLYASPEQKNDRL
jgi:hypothetical protein